MLIFVNVFYADFDNDGDLDLQVSESWKDTTTANLKSLALYENDGSGNFTDISWQSGFLDTFQTGARQISL